MITHLLRLPTLRRWRLYEHILLSSRRYSTTKASKKKVDPAVVDTWKRDVVLMLNSELKLEHKRYSAQKFLLTHEHKVVW
jgi:DNA-binding response OmpR family regulator